jgi:small subunit ribosomal protein S20
MPNKKSAEKELRKAKKRAIANKKVLTKTKVSIKANLKKIAANDKTVAEDLKLTFKALDKAAKKGVITKNTASRKKSRLAKKVNTLK